MSNHRKSSMNKALHAFLDSSNFRAVNLRLYLCILTIGTLSAYADNLQRITPPTTNLRLGPPPPTIDPPYQTFLLRLARRTFVQRLRNDRSYELEYVPLDLQGTHCRVSVALRAHGEILGTADAETGPVAQACQQAAEAALIAAQKTRSISLKDMADSTLEVELIGPREYVGEGDQSPVLLAQHYEPAIHGIAVHVNGKEVLVRPSQLISRATLCEVNGSWDHRCNRYEVAIENFQEKLGSRRKSDDGKPRNIEFLRFRTTHLYEPEPGAQAIELIGGMRIVQSEEVTQMSLLAAADNLANHIRSRQESDGFFAYEFLPGRNMYWPKGQNWVRQAGTTWVMAVHARNRNDAASNEVLQRTLQAFSKMATPFPDNDRAAYIATPDGKNQLGATALICLAMIDAPNRDEYEDLRIALLNGLASMQQDNGSFRTHFPPSTSTGSQDYSPGEALLAIAKHYALTRDGRWRQICEKALPFYIAYFRKHKPPAFIPWQAQAYGQLARTTRLQRYANFVFEMTDLLVETQMKKTDAILPIYQGAFDVYHAGRAGITTAVYLEGCVDAARTAIAMNDQARAKRYLKASQKAARFVMQLRFRPEECYYVQSPEKVLGGVRNSPSDPTLRIDHTQHALAALLGTAGLLSTPKPPAQN